jgi:hypothetical protein
MMAAIIFVISIIAFGQFGICYWRATIAAASKVPVSDRVRLAAGISTGSLSSRDFRAILDLHAVTPALKGSQSQFLVIRAYYLVMAKLAQAVPAANKWAESEMTMCSNYMAVLLDRHIERNLACAMRVRGM